MKKEISIMVLFNILLVSTFAALLYVEPVKAEAPYLMYVIEYYCPGLIDWAPYGKLNLIVTICKLAIDGNPNYDWYFYSSAQYGFEGIRLETVLGCVCFGSDWETAHTYAYHSVVDPGTCRWLTDTSPGTTDGFTSATASVEVTISPKGEVGGGFSLSYTYDIPYVKVLGYSDIDENVANWEHDFNEQGDPPGSPSDTSYISRPAFVVKTTRDAWSLVDAWYGVDFGHPVYFWWEYATASFGTLPLDAGPPAFAMKTGSDGHFYVPNYSVSGFEIEEISQVDTIVGDQSGGTSVWETMENWPDGLVSMTDTIFVTTHFGSSEGGGNWQYMADVDANRIISMGDLMVVLRHFGNQGTYSHNLSGIQVFFNDQTSAFPDQEGWVPLSPGATAFDIKKNGNPVSALITFWP